MRTLSDDDLWTLTERVNVPAVLRAALADPHSSGTTPTRQDPWVDPLSSGTPTPATTPTSDDPGDESPYLLVADPLTGGKAELPADVVRAVRQAGCAAAAAVDLLPPAVITAGVVGTAPSVWWHARVLCQALPAITHIAVTADGPPPARLADHLDLAGVGLSVAPDAPSAAFGANLVVAAGPARLAAEGITAGAVLVEAVPDAFPANLRTPDDAEFPPPFRLVPPSAGCHSPALDAHLAAALIAAFPPES